MTIWQLPKTIVKPRPRKLLWQSWVRRMQTHMYAVCALAIAILVVTLRQWGGLQPLELFAYDALVRLQPDLGPSPELVVIGITETDIRAQNQWPLSDQVIANLITKLQRHNPRAIGLDLYRDVPHPPGNERLQRQLQSENVFAVTSLGTDVDDYVPPPAGMPWDQVGFNDFVIDSDGILRRNFMYAALGEEEYYSFALRISLKALADGKTDLQVVGDTLFIKGHPLPALTTNAGGYQSIDAAGYQTMLQYCSTDSVARQLSLNQILDGDFDPAWLENKIILIGTVAPSEKDFFYTPYSAIKDDKHVMPGVMVHAQMIHQLLGIARQEKSVIWYWTQLQEAFWIMLWALAGGLISWRFKHPLSIGVALGAALITLITICSLVFAHAGWIPLLPSALALLLTGLATVAYIVFYRSFYDPLTGLPNRSTFLKRLQRQLSQNVTQANTSAVLFLDIDDFKVINESCGHRAGDDFLVTFASEIKACLPKSMVARVGVDKFSILLPSVAHSKSAIETADQLQKLLNRPHNIGQQSIILTASVGIALSQSGYCHKAEDLLQDAHRATYRAKKLGRDRYEVFSQGMRTQAVSRFQLEMEMRQALNNQAFQLYYQPIIGLKTGRIAGFEALIRWIHPKRGFISPGEFIPVAEETGMILPLGQWILREACRQMHQWHGEFSQEPPLFISVNLSSKQFSQSSLTDEVEQILQETGLRRQSLKLELTESAAMEDVEHAIKQLLRLKTMELQISLDDFGTGYSSLSYLHQFPTDTLKVDQSFVGRMEKASSDSDVVSTIIALGHKLGMDIVAEGIETPEQLEQLRDFNCDYGQGYFFAKPLDPEKAEAVLTENPQW